VEWSAVVVLGSVALAVACGRTGLVSFADDSAGASADSGDAGNGGNGTGGRSASGGNGASAAMAGMGASGGSVAVAGSGGSVAGTGVGGALSGGAGGQSMGGQAGTLPAGAAGMPSFECGNGEVELGEACDPGDEPSPPALELRQGDFRAEVGPIVGFESANQFYRYGSASSHTGFEEILASRLYLYRWDVEEALSLVMHHGIDEEASGLVQPESAVTFDFEGLPPTAVVSLSDEPNEFFRSDRAAALAVWTFRRNTDGGVIGGLPFPGSWHLIVTPQFLAGVSDFRFLAGTGTPDLGVAVAQGLLLATPVEIVSSDNIGSCRADCTVPICGDSRLDPGEVCDDGNSLEGDGCSGCRPELR
jgi:cysteine-rich repeat protein